MNPIPTINEIELERVVACLDVINPGRVTAENIRWMISREWPFHNVATGGWVAYAENPDNPVNGNVRLALTPWSVQKYLEAQSPAQA